MMMMMCWILWMPELLPVGWVGCGAWVGLAAVGLGGWVARLGWVGAGAWVGAWVGGAAVSVAATVDGGVGAVVGPASEHAISMTSTAKLPTNRRQWDIQASNGTASRLRVYDRWPGTAINN